MSLFTKTNLDLLYSPIDLLLKEFEDMFPEEMPLGLPPLRGIEHQIDFFPGTVMPNRPIYRANLEESKELQDQISDLLNKGYVHESVSPCSQSRSKMALGGCM